MNFPRYKATNLFISASGFVIRCDGNADDYPPYWTAYRPDANGKPCLDPKHELGGGAGDEGFRKCVALCDLDMRAPKSGNAPAAQAAPAVSPIENSTPKSCESNSNTGAPQQQGLAL